MPRLTSLTPRHAQPRRSPDRSTRPTLEGLEDRYLLSSLEGGQWTYGSRITYSFMPDGTNVGGVGSSLSRTMNSYYPTATWQQAIEKAAAIWQVVANINLAQVSDNGEPEGAAGNQQGDPNVGDIRIGAIPESSGQLAYTLIPPPVNGGTNAGDILFNANQTWGSSGFDLETVAIHEFGHALGLGESTVQQAVMYTYYEGARTTLNADDICAIQSLYGAVPPDSDNNWSFLTATNLTPNIDGNGQIALSGASIASSLDNEWYSVTVPSNTTGNMVVTMQSSNLSSLSPRVTVYNGLVLGLGQASAANTYGATVSYTVNNVHPGQVYYIRASAANTGAGSDGAFGLLVNFGSLAQAPVAPPNTAVPSQPDQGGGFQYQLINGPVADTPGQGGSTVANWWGNWLASLASGNGSTSSSSPSASRNGQASSGAGQFRLGSLLAWGEGLSLAPGAGNAAPANLATRGTGVLTENQASSLPVIIAPQFNAPTSGLPGAFDPGGDGSSRASLFALDLVLGGWSDPQHDSNHS